MATKRATIVDVARLSGVSMKTVSRVFNREANVRPTTRDKVLAAAESLDYRPNLSARQLASDLTFLIGMLYDNPNGDYITAVQSGVLQQCRENGYNLLINPCPGDDPDVVREALDLQHQVDGLILLQPLSDREDLNQLLTERNIPCVRISQRPFPGFPWISVNDDEAAEQMTDYLLDLGHRRIGFIVGHPDHGQSLDRLSGYHAALRKRGLPRDGDLIQQGLFDFRSGYKAAKSLLALPSPPTAVFASSDAMATGVLSAARELGLDVPRDLSVAGYDDSPLARHASPPLTTVRQPIAEVARLATELLLAQLRNREDVASSHRLKAELVCRESTIRID